MELGFLCVEMNTMQIYDCQNSWNGKTYTEQELLKRANDSKKEDIDLYTKYIKKYPKKSDYWEGQLEAAKKKNYQIIKDYDTFAKMEKQRFCSREPQEITKEEYYNARDVLPPILWGTRGNCEMFCMREMYTGSITTQYAYNLVDGKYYSKLVDVTDKETWIDAYFRNKL